MKAERIRLLDERSSGVAQMTDAFSPSPERARFEVRFRWLAASHEESRKRDGFRRLRLYGS